MLFTRRNNLANGKRGRIFSFLSLFALVLFCASSAVADVGVKVTGPAGSNTQSLPGNSGQFNIKVPLAKNTINTLTVMATDAQGNTASRDIKVTQISFDSLLVAQVKAEPLPPEKIEQLVKDGVINIDDPKNFNVSQFSIVLTIAQEQIPISLPIVVPKEKPENLGYETYSLPGGDGRGGGRPPDAPPVEVIVFEIYPPGPPGVPPPPPIPGVIVIDGRIKTLKEFYSVKFLMINTSGIFTLQDVSAMIEFPDGGLSSTLPEDGIGSLGDIVPGDGGLPSQAQKEFIVRGDEIGVRRVKVSFGGKVGGAGIPEGDEVPFNGSAETSVEVKGPPKFTVRVTHPDNVVFMVPYKLGIEIINTGETPALYTSLDLDVGFDAKLLDCKLNNGGDPECTEAEGPQKTTFGHILPGQTVRKEFDVKPLASGPISSCMGISDQNITLQVSAGNLGCLVGQFSPDRFNADGIPAVSVLPGNNFIGVSLNSPVTGFFTKPMNEGTITTGLGGTLNVYDGSGAIQPGELRFATLNGDTVVIWQFKDGITNRLSPDTTYTVQFTQGILGADGKPLISQTTTKFTTTGEGIDDFVPPVLTLGVEPGVNPNNVIPGQVAKISAYPTDQGSGIRRVELRIRDLDVANAPFKLVDQKKYTLGDTFPYFFNIDSKNLIAGHTYQLKGTAYDGVGNPGESTLALTVATVAPIPTITLPVSPGQVLKGITIPVTPVQVTGGTFEVSYILDGVPLKTVGIAPYQIILSTLTLDLGVHALKAVARDGLNQMGEATLQFEVIENTNAPIVSFIAPEVDADIVTGTLMPISANIDDPVGVKSVKWYFDNPNGTPFAQGVTKFALNTTGIPLGAHTLYVVATNNLDLSTSISDPTTFREFEIINPPPEPAPPPPGITNITFPSGGETIVTGTTNPNRRVDISNTSFGNTVSVLSNSAGVFTASVTADSGNTISVIAFNAAQTFSSSPATVLVPTPVAVVSIDLIPTSKTFTTFGDFIDATVIAHYADSSVQDITAFATYTSSKGSVAGVNAAGRIVAVGNGTATITASYNNTVATADITVNARVLSSISVSPPSVTFAGIGQQQQLSVTGHFSDSTDEPLNGGVLFQTGDPQVATVSTGGLITATGNGNTDVTVFKSGVPSVVVPVTLNLSDATLPTVSFSSPANGADVQRGQNVAVNLQAQDTISGVKKVSLMASGQANFSDFHQIAPALNTVETFNFVVPASAAIGGTITLSATAEDDTGNVSAVASITLDVVDTVAPTLTITEPAPETEVGFGDQVTVGISANDAVGVTEIRYATEGSFAFNGSQAFAAQPGNRVASFNFSVPFGLTDPDVIIRAFAKDSSGNEREAVPVHLIVGDADIIPPATEATGVSNPGSGSTTSVSYQVTDGLSDLDHVELFFRRNGIGTFNRYTDAAGGNAKGEFHPQGGATGTILFDSTRMGGDGNFEFYTVGVDAAGNREPAPMNVNVVAPDQTLVFNSGAAVSVISTDTIISSGDTSFDDKNIRISGAKVTVEGAHTFRNVELLNAAVLTHLKTTLSTEYGLNLNAWTLTVDSTSSINVNALGYLGGLSNGSSTCEGRTLGNSLGAGYRAGASYGGPGGTQSAATNPLYGVLTNAVELGSGGGCGGSTNTPGGDGGGRLALTLINLVSDGKISADGGNGPQGFAAGNGSGGGIHLILSTMSGTGLVEANGSSPSGGFNEVGGGGGRIAVYFVDVSTLNRSNVKALGGLSSQTVGGNGTVFFKGIDEANGSLLIDGQGGSTIFSPIPIPPGFVFDDITIRNNARVLVDVPLELSGKLSIESGSILTHSSGLEAGLKITAAEVAVDATSKIDVSARGYRGGLNSGRPLCEGETLFGIIGAGYRAGASYGGQGGTQSQATNPAYGNPKDPNMLGSGGGCGGSTNTAGGNGGGRIEINASESVLVDGAIRADGQNGPSGFAAGNGSGGAIKITTSLFKGTGVVTANGFAESGGFNEVGGGGGRIAVFYDFLPVAGNDLNGLKNVNAFGGHSSQTLASAGTVYFHRKDQSDGDLYIDEGLPAGTTSPAFSPLTHVGFGTSTGLTADTLTTNGSVPLMPNGLVGLRINPNLNQNETFVVTANTSNTITVAPNGSTDLLDVAQLGDPYAAEYNFENVYLRRGASFILGDKLNVSETFTASDNSRLSHYSASFTVFDRLEISAEDFVIDAGSSVDVSARGYLGGLSAENSACEGRTLGNTPGSGYKAGGSYAGLGGSLSAAPGPIYGNVTDPAALGSGGGCGGSTNTPGGSGGGWVHIVASNIVVNGTLAANGGNIPNGFQAGNGSGGSINLVTGSLSGTGLITANGVSLGAGFNEVGGGGGRIAVRYVSLTFPQANLRVLAGGPSNASGGAGTLYLKGPGQTLGDLVIDGMNGESDVDRAPYPANVSFDNVIFRNKARVSTTKPIVASGSVQLLNSSMLTHPVAFEGGVSIQAQSVLVDSTSAIDVSARGYQGGLNSGNLACEGKTIGSTTGAPYKAGGSYGGYAGMGSGGSVPSPAYGTPQDPMYLGAGGGCGGSTNTAGGNGGGRVEIQASGNVIVDGAVRADGQNGPSGFESGNGSGGSLKISAGRLAGNGLLTANGFSASVGFNEVGGSGGRIALFYTNFGGVEGDFAASRNIRSFGGKNSYSGGAGTIFRKTGSQNFGDLYFDEGLVGTTSSKETGLTRIGFGTSALVSGSTVTSDGTRAFAPGGLVGLAVNPNLDQNSTFTIISNSADSFQVNGPLSGVAQSGDSYSGVYHFDNVVLRGGARVALDDKLIVEGEMLVSENSVLTQQSTTLSLVSKIDVVAGNFTLDANSFLNVDGKGYLGGLRGGNSSCEGRTLGNVLGSGYKAGGSYGGLGASASASPNPLYGSASDPDELGSGGGCGGSTNTPGGNGGGLVKLSAGTLVLNGSILARGEGGPNGFQGANGSGGGVNISAINFSGSGSIDAQGSSPFGSNEVGGGGGRVKVSRVVNQFTGSIAAAGGAASLAGQAGTVVIQ